MSLFLPVLDYNGNLVQKASCVIGGLCDSGLHVAIPPPSAAGFLALFSEAFGPSLDSESLFIYKLNDDILLVDARQSAFQDMVILGFFDIESRVKVRDALSDNFCSSEKVSLKRLKKGPISEQWVLKEGGIRGKRAVLLV